MHQDRVLKLTQPFRIIVAVETTRLLSRSSSARHIIVTRNTGNEILYVLGVIDHHSPHLRNRGSRVAACASGKRLTGWTLFEMAQVTGYFSDREVFTLYDLRVTARTPQLLSPPKFTEVFVVIEPNTLKVEIRIQCTFHMTTRTQTGRVFNLSPGLDPVRSRYVPHYLVSGLELAHRFRSYPGSVVTFDARNFAMARSRPRVVVRLHDVTVCAEIRRSAVLDESNGSDCSQDDESDDAVGSNP